MGVARKGRWTTAKRKNRSQMTMIVLNRNAEKGLVKAQKDSGKSTYVSNMIGKWGMTNGYFRKCHSSSKINIICGKLKFMFTNII